MWLRRDNSSGEVGLGTVISIIKYSYSSEENDMATHETNEARSTQPTQPTQQNEAPGPDGAPSPDGAQNKYKVYFALLNNGPIRREMSSTVIPAMNRTKGVELIWENPNKTWANPISSNRCQIVKRFLATDCTHLLMIDDDVVPLFNPCELVYVDRDVVGAPALVRSAGQTMVWTAYTVHSSGQGYSAIDLDSIDDMFDVIEVAIVGTGCIMVKREVLENIKQPFHSMFDDDGIQTYGTDFAFCRRVTDAGYKVFTTTHKRCEHFKELGLSNITAWDLVDNFDTANSKYGLHWGDYAITQRDWNFIASRAAHIRLNQIDLDPLKPLPKLKVLEFGAGLSSLLLSETCKVVTYETDPEYKKLIEAKITDQNDLEVRLWDGVTPAEVLFGHPRTSYDRFDLVFVDGPKDTRKGGVGRSEAIRTASQVSDNIIVHDAGRQEEWAYQRKHLRGIFKLERKSGSHMTRCHYWKRRPKPVTIADVCATLS